jgi:hypothetical protein
LAPEGDRDAGGELILKRAQGEVAAQAGTDGGALLDRGEGLGEAADELGSAVDERLRERHCERGAKPRSAEQ